VQGMVYCDTCRSANALGFMR
uniref:Pollen allergen Beta v 1 (Fragments) n=1 Tax=Beta vulgaris TaxID=161934 RepID=BETA1_BETVU|nr:RecName: Full=Pollen allergen Beta v 1; AltName: Allergen=Beta v 1 [Beta vulgaris]